MEPFYNGRYHGYYLVRDRYALGFCIGLSDHGDCRGLCCWCRAVQKQKLNSLSYILFSLGGTGSYIVFFADPNGWAQTMLGNGTEQSYIDTMQATANTGILIAMFAAAIITSAISAFVGCKMLKKQFEKAGITA